MTWRGITRAVGERCGAPVLALLLIVTACTSGEADTSTTTVTTAPPSTTVATTVAPAGEPVEEPPDPGFYVMLLWTLHQPRYPLADDGTVSRPWVRLEAVNRYLSLASIHDRFPEVAATFNLSPTLLLQLDELAGGVEDGYQAVAEVDAADLDEGQQRFLVERFFDVDRAVLDRFPRYLELWEERDRAGDVAGALERFDEHDLRDLQVLFNLAWIDPGLLAVEPLASLVAKERDYTEEDKAQVLAEHARIVGEVIPEYARLWVGDRVEVTTSPLASPVLPLLVDPSLATVGDPVAAMPVGELPQTTDAADQVAAGLDVAQRLLGRRPAGLWPVEGALADPVIPVLAAGGIGWAASGEAVLASSLGMSSFTRDEAGRLGEPDLLYRPWRSEHDRDDPVHVFFGDVELSELIAGRYADLPPEEAASDLMERLGAIRRALDTAGALDPDRPPVVTVVLDAETALADHPDNGTALLESWFQRLSQSETIGTITPSAYLARYGEGDRLEQIGPGSWTGADYTPWIGEPEEAAAWEYLYEVREDLAQAEASGLHTGDQLDAAHQAMLLAEAADWFAWYGDDRDSGNDAFFDAAYREQLGEVYDGLEVPRPVFLDVPIVPATAVEADRVPSEPLAVTLDTSAGTSEWSDAGRYEDLDRDDGPIETLYQGFDAENLYVRVDFVEDLLGAPESGFELYLGAPGAATLRGSSLRGTPLGFGARALIEWSGDDPLSACFYPTVPEVGGESELESCEARPVGFDGDSVELSIPLGELGSLRFGDRLLFRIVPTEGFREQAVVPGAGPAAVQRPAPGADDALLWVADPRRDDHGPGGYRYPSGDEFESGSFDLTGFGVVSEGEDLVFVFETEATIADPWGAPRGFSLQTFDLYIDTDPGAGTGARLLLPGRTAALAGGNGWEYAITIDGWGASFSAVTDGRQATSRPTLPLAVIDGGRRVIVRVPQTLLGEGDPTAWGYGAILNGSADPATGGVGGLREVATEAGERVFWGAPDDVNHTRVIDVAWPAAGEQEALLGDYEPIATGSIDDLGVADVGTIPLNLVPPPDEEA